MNGGLLPMSNGLSRLQTRFLGDEGKVADLLKRAEPYRAADALTRGSSPSRRTRSTGTTKCVWPSKRARRSLPTR